MKPVEGDASHLLVVDVLFAYDFQESVVTSLANSLDNDTMETLKLAEQLSTNLTDLNNNIEGNMSLFGKLQTIRPSCKLP